jgi:hypothetical protein
MEVGAATAESAVAGSHVVHTLPGVSVLTCGIFTGYVGTDVLTVEVPAVLTKLAMSFLVELADTAGKGDIS